MWNAFTKLLVENPSIPGVLISGGIVFLLLAVIGPIQVKEINIAPNRWLAGVVGFLLLLVGLVFVVTIETASTTSNEQADSRSTSEIPPIDTGLPTPTFETSIQEDSQPVSDDASSEPADEVAPDPLLLVQANADWTPTTQIIDGTLMALVPGGCFSMGARDGDADEQPVHEQCFGSPYWIDVNEVTNSEYGAPGKWAGELRPRDTVTWFDANQHCLGRGARLPTEAEWEYAARGPDSLQYPWGNNFSAGNLLFAGSSNHTTEDVDARPQGQSWVGAEGMSGNVWEWVSSIYAPYPYDATDGREADPSIDNFSPRVLRGGAFSSSQIDSSASHRIRYVPTVSNEVFGFRCASDHQ